jgi:hypothetical protein
MVLISIEIMDWEWVCPGSGIEIPQISRLSYEILFINSSRYLEKLSLDLHSQKPSQIF